MEGNILISLAGRIATTSRHQFWIASDSHACVQNGDDYFILTNPSML